MTFSKNGYEVVRNVISKQLLHHLKLEFEMIKNIKFFETNSKNLYEFADNQTEKSFCVYSATCFESLSLQLQDLMSEVTQKNLHPTYSYARIYYKGAILDPHTDRKSCEYSTTICIDSTDIWDFYIEDRNGEKNALKLNPGDMCVYSGCELLHWREKYEGQQQMQCFLHYVDSNGPYKNFKYDERPILGIKKFKKSKSKYHYK